MPYYCNINYTRVLKVECIKLLICCFGMGDVYLG